MCIALLAGCGGIAPAAPPLPGLEGIQSTEAVSITITELPPMPPPTSTPPSIWLGEELPALFREVFTLPNGYAQGGDEENAVLRVGSREVSGEGAVIWVYALVAPFPTITDGVSEEALHKLWQGSPGQLPVKTLLVEESTRALFEQRYGPPGATVRVERTGRLLGTAWQDKTTWAIVPFEDLEPRWKVLAVDGLSPVQKQFRADEYPLSARFAVVDREGMLLTDIPLPASNRDLSLLTTVAVTGVTALVRATAGYMEQFGMTYPADNIGDLLREADILHISNEVAFAENCPSPLPWDGLNFCSQTRYIELLDSIGTDVVDLSGDHFKDWGVDAMNHTLDLYEERGWQVYGGGRNIQAARQPAYFEINGTKIAFLGCNAKPVGYSTAAEEIPGAIHCDMDQMEQSVKDLVAEGYLPIVTFQHLEYESYDPHPILQADFARMASAGALIVAGTQAHQPHAMTFQGDSFLHYGLGNLFFDQLKEGTPMRQAFIDRHVFYNGRYISTELITIWFVDYAKTRFMETDEREDLLRIVFNASGWNTP